jgi:hypothetical protein
MTVNITLTFPETVIKKIDKDRHDVNRSRYILRLIEQAYLNCGTKVDVKKQMELQQQKADKIGVQSPSQSTAVAEVTKTTHRDDSGHD